MFYVNIMLNTRKKKTCNRPTKDKVKGIKANNM